MRPARHRWGIAVTARGLAYLQGHTGVWVQACLDCWLRRLIRLPPGRRYAELGNRDTRGAWTIATAPAAQSGYRPARVVGPCLTPGGRKR